MGYARGVGYFVGILIIILGLIIRMQSASTSGIITGIIIVIVGIIFISFVRKIGGLLKVEPRADRAALFIVGRMAQVSVDKAERSCVSAM